MGFILFNISAELLNQMILEMKDDKYFNTINLEVINFNESKKGTKQFVIHREGFRPGEEREYLETAVFEFVGDLRLY